LAAQNKNINYMKRYIAAAALLCLALPSMAKVGADPAMDKFIDDLMSRMTLKERIGQLNLGGVGSPKVVGSAKGLDVAIKEGLVSSIGGFDPKAAEDAQRFAEDNMRVFVPMITGLDVVHGYYTTFPIPLGSASSWNLPLLEESARVAAREATAFGINWTFAPMVDISRDPRWGRVAEGAGEDPYLGSQIAAAMVHGYQGDDLTDPETIMACTKHLVLYGASEAGRDYNTVSMDDVTAYNYFLPTYKAAFDAGAGSGMTSFNVVNGVPTTGNRKVMTELLRDRWGFDGFIVSDANAIAEMIEHGVGDAQMVAEMALKAGTDMDMSSSLYVVCLEKAVAEGRVSEEEIDTACRRVLEAKYKLGLLHKPWLYYTNKNRRKEIILSPENLDVARRLARESIVLLKNSDKTLPLKEVNKIAVVGPMGQERGELLGTWSYGMSADTMSTIVEALAREVGPGTEVVYSQGSNWTEEPAIYKQGGKHPSDSLLMQAVNDVADADIIIATVGEPAMWSGEAHNRTNPSLPQAQMNLLRAMKATGKPVVVALFSGRPLIIPEVEEEFSTILQAWHGGTMAPEAFVDIVTGKEAPSGKLTSTWPRNVGQIPLYYNALRTGRPYSKFWATTKYIDSTNDPLYPFGYGLSYNDYEYSDVRADKLQAKGDKDIIRVSVDVTNRGTMPGKEVVQLYINDPIAKISRPVLELKDFAKVSLVPGETKTVSFDVTTDKLKYYNPDLKYDWDEGEFAIFVGPNSQKLEKLIVNWRK